MSFSQSASYQLCSRPLSELAAELANGKLSDQALAEASLANQRFCDEHLQAYQFRNEAAFLASAGKAARLRSRGEAGPLTGLPVSVKSLFAAEGYQCYAGTKFPLPDAWQQPGTVVTRLQQMAAPLSGLTHASELAFSGLGINPHWGTPRNPWDAQHHRVPGGSSAGAAISVLCGSAQFALGTDTGGSVRVPAALAGLPGLKLTAGRWPMDGVVPLSTHFDSLGIIARSVADLTLVFKALDPHPAPAETGSWRFVLADSSSTETLAEPLHQAFFAVIDTIKRAGIEVTDCAHGLFRQIRTLLREGPNTAAIECAAFIASEIPSWRHELGPRTDVLISEGERVSAVDYLNRMKQLTAIQDYAGRRLDEDAIMLSPTTTRSAPLLSELHNNAAQASASGALLQNTVVANICGFCALTLPCGFDDEGQPLGLQLMARGHQEHRLLAAAAQLEACLDFRRPVPPVFA
ncbi:amidase [Granulosicoccaceae sp. 1_MG-2023]|nr:amidase [Granulosicoccaceae sp. 1_MG-2023]